MASLFLGVGRSLGFKVNYCPRVLVRLFSISKSDTDDQITDDFDDDFIYERIPRTKAEYSRRNSLPIDQPDEPRLNRVSIIGLPNSGKSTLVNQLTGLRITSVSRKVHTTRKNIIGIFNEGSTQIELLDTPGLVKLKHCVDFNLEHTLYNNPRLSAKVADLIAVLVDASQKRYINFLDYETFKLLSKHKDKKSILVLNKVDRTKDKSMLLTAVDNLTGRFIEGESIEGKERKETRKPLAKSIKMLIEETEKRLSQSPVETDLPQSEELREKLPKDLFNLYWPNFSKVFMVSALTGDGVDELKDYMIETAKPCQWKYNEKIVTNQDPQALAISIVREKFLDHGQWDTPYLLKFRIVTWELDEMKNLHIVITALCPKSAKMISIIGPEGGLIARISAEARQELIDTFNCEVRLKVIVKCTERAKDKVFDSERDKTYISKWNQKNADLVHKTRGTHD
ncbi:GTPase Era, mitochondrial-like [Panonychus citri]|uniref:GTPase Era, mitochondrial-like n=1 Tax=Panonychus citri TaxID=50023 RepID=UPI002307C9EA|nr:GTPase Era, mitochondrial-like [Panonychus citri]